MRLAACALSTVLLSGCSWFGVGGYHGDTYGYDNYGYGYDGGMYGQYSYAGYDGCGGAVVVAGCETAYGYGYDAGAHGGYATTLSAAAPYGVAVDGYAAGHGSYAYVDQGYGAHHGVAVATPAYGYAVGDPCCAGGSRFGYEATVGTEYVLSGEVFQGEASKPFLGGPGTVSDLAPVKYSDAFGNATTLEFATTYDLNPKTQLIGQVGYSTAAGQSVELGTVDDGAGTTEVLSAEFSDLEKYTLEGGFRRYLGASGHSGSGFRPFVGASLGFSAVKDVLLTQSSDTLVDPNVFVQEYIDGGWHPIASASLGAEWQVGHRTALGIETGLKYQSALDTNLGSDGHWSVPVKLRGRIEF